MLNIFTTDCIVILYEEKIKLDVFLDIMEQTKNDDEILHKNLLEARKIFVELENKYLKKGPFQLIG